VRDGQTGPGEPSEEDAAEFFTYLISRLDEQLTFIKNVYDGAGTDLPLKSYTRSDRNYCYSS
jgi:hypothetical protein